MKHSATHFRTFTSAWLAVMACGCGGSEDQDPAGSGGSGSSTAGTSAMPVAGTSASPAGQQAPDEGPGGFLDAECPPDESPSSCGGVACAPVDPQAALLCTQGCCTAQGTCGTFNPNLGTECVDVSGGEGHACPMETVFGAYVPGCCYEGMDSCGVLDVTGLLGAAAGGDANNCVLRTNVPLAGLEALRCDGTPAPPPAGAGGSASTGAGGGGQMAGSGGSGGSGSGGSSMSDECPAGMVCAENSFIAAQMPNFRFCGSDQGAFGHTPPAATSQQDCDDGPGGSFQTFAGLIQGCILSCD